jgi:aminoacyl tRNA synthase complex-interacting multifunctional protein 1
VAELTSLRVSLVDGHVVIRHANINFLSVKAQAQNGSDAPKPEPSTPSSNEGEKKEGKKEKKKGEPAKKNAPAAPADTGAPVDVGRLDMRVGLIRKAEKHPDADGLYLEEVDVGEDKPRTVISGLVKFIPLEEMQNRKAILLCNLKPAKMRGVMSQAMVMCASTPDKVEILAPPENSAPGDVVLVEGFERAPDAQLNPKKKIFEACAPDLKVNGEGVATYKGIPWTVNGKTCVSQTLRNVQIK